jgi:hypothetical protein
MGAGLCSPGNINKLTAGIPANASPQPLYFQNFGNSNPHPRMAILNTYPALSSYR